MKNPIHNNPCLWSLLSRCASLRTCLASLILISAVAQSPAQSTSTLTNSDGLNTSSFNTAHYWSGGLLPGPGTNYFTSTFTMRTPSTAGNYTFLGDSLTINTGGGMSLKSGSGSTITMNNRNLVQTPNLASSRLFPLFFARLS